MTTKGQETLSEDPLADIAFDNDLQSVVATQAEDIGNDGEKFQLLPYEHDIMLETFEDDVLFVVARGMGMERLFLNHLFLYSDPKILTFVINTTSTDDIFFLEQMNNSKLDCAPKLINSEMLIKDREVLYKTGGVQFVTSRILMVDLLNNRVPMEQLAGIVVFRAHDFQETFILRLFREKKTDGGGFVKAFTDLPSALTESIGQLQRLIDRLFVRRVRLIPRFDVDVKDCMHSDRAPKLLEFNVCLPPAWRKVHAGLVDIIRTCLRELKQSSASNANELDVDEESCSPMAALFETHLERGLIAIVASISEKQKRLLNDLKQLRTLLRQAEQLDPITLYQTFSDLRKDKQTVANNSGWLFTPTAGKIFAETEKLCGITVEEGTSSSSEKKCQFSEPAKWSALKTVLHEIRNLVAMGKSVALDEDDDSLKEKSISDGGVLLFAYDEASCRQLADLIKWGPAKLKWILQKQLRAIHGEFAKDVEEPVLEPWWQPDQVVLSNSTNSAQSRADLLTKMRQQQKATSRELQTKRRKAKANPTVSAIIQEAVAKRRKLTTNSKKNKGDVDAGQMRITQFGIVAHEKAMKAAEEKKIDDEEDEGNSASTSSSSPIKCETLDEAFCEVEEPQNDPLLLIRPVGERYNLIRQLETLRPNYVVMYHVDLATMRQLEVYKAVNHERPLAIYTLQYSESSEEERYLWSLRKEFQAFEQLIRQQATLLIPREFDVIREPAARLTLKPAPSTRDRGGRGRLEEMAMGMTDRPKVIVDLREFNSALPSAIYRAGIDLQLATLEVGDYVLSPEICIERKSHSDLEGSLQSGRVFKQIDQMLRHYKNSVLLVEGSSRNVQLKRSAIGPFAGEMGRRCRESRSALCRLIRAFPRMSIVWSLEATHSVELFQEIKLDAPDPDLTQAMAYRSDDLDGSSDKNDQDPSALVDARILGLSSTSANSTNLSLDEINPTTSSNVPRPMRSQSHPVINAGKQALNSSIQRILKRLPPEAAGSDVSRLMRAPSSGGNLLSLMTADRDNLLLSTDGNAVQADALLKFFSGSLMKTKK